VDKRRTGEVASHIAMARVARRMTQEQLAAAASISTSLLRKIELGARSVTPTVLLSIAEALDVDPGQLAGTTSVTDGRVHESIPDVRRALDTYDFPDDGPVRAVAELATDVALAERRRLNSRYARLAEDAPRLLTDLCRAFHHSAGNERVQVARLLTSGLRSVDGMAYKFGYRDLSARLIDLMQRTAIQADDVLLMAAVSYVRTETFFATGNLTAALRALDVAADRLAAATPAGRAAYGALHMRAAVVAARLGDRDAAWAHLREASEMAALTPESVYYGTAFGPDSVKVHEVAVAVELGDESRALRTAGGWAPPSALPAERRSHYYVDLARAQLWAGRRHAALASLQTARQIAPQHVREHPHVHETVATLMRLRRRPDDELVGFASWLRMA
jgi:transcriptional regulator with XRE-family HTH domain